MTIARRCRIVGAGLLAMLALCTEAMPQAFPSRVVRVVVPFAPGGAVDAIARTLAAELAQAWNQQVVVDNRPGASGIIGAEGVSRSTADGYTLLFAPSTLVVNPFVTKNYASINPAKDLRPLNLVATGDLLFVVSARAEGGPRTIDDFVRKAKANPEKYNFATGGFGSAGHLAAEYFKARTGLSIPVVLYRGTGPAFTDLLSGQVSALMDPLLTSLPHVQSGGLHGLAIMGTKRSPLAPEIRTMSEAGYADVDIFTWYGLWAPAALPDDVAASIELAVLRILAADASKRWFAIQGLEPSAKTGPAFASFIQNETEKYRRIIDDAHIAPQ